MRYVATLIMASMMREAPALADKTLYSASAMATAQIEGKHIMMNWSGRAC